MAKILQLRRGTTAQNDAFTGADGEVTVDTEKKALRLHDGATVGGTEIGKTPTKVSAFENDAGYLTQHQSLDAYATKASLKAVATSGSYNDLTDKPAVPTVDSALSSSSTNPVQNKVINSALANKMALSPAAIEFAPGSNATHGGFLDFHFKNSTADYTSRIIELASGTLTVTGALTVSGVLSGATVKATSDKRKKTCITKMSTDLSSLSAYRYKFKKPSDADKGFHVGLIAQEVEKVLPEAVSKDDKGFLTLDYNAVVAVLVDEVNQLKSEIKQLKAKHA